MRGKKGPDFDIAAIIDQICREKGISSEILTEAIEMAVSSAAKKHLKTEENIEVHFNKQTGEMETFSVKNVVEQVENPYTQISFADARKINNDVAIGDDVEIPRSFDGLSRIAAQAAKQVIVQRVREAERDIVFNYFNERVGQLVNGSVLRVEKGNIIVDLGRTEAILPKKEQSPRDNYRRGERIRAYLMEVKKSTQGPQIVLSRIHPNLLNRLFEMEVPEIYEGIVEIRGSSREPGERAKVCVSSHDPSVDPVGACVGMKGSRVQAIVKELRGENIDVVEWTDDTAQFIRNALSPAQANRIYLNLEDRIAKVVVTDQQLSLAIGKRGQNVRLAAKLTNWKIDIKSEAEIEREKNESKLREEQLIATLTQIPGITTEILNAIALGGYTSLESLARATEEELTKLKGIGPARAQKIIQTAQQALEGTTKTDVETTTDSTEQGEIPPEEEEA